MENDEWKPTLEEILVDFPPGPLDAFRKEATFDRKKLMLHLYGEDLLRFRVSLLSQ